MDVLVERCKCHSSECPVVLMLHDKSRHFVCKHLLMSVSEYFETMFQTDMKEKQTNEVELREDISKTDLVVFLDAIQKPFKPLPSDAVALQSLIFLADRFMCPSLGEEILPYLINGALFSASAEVKIGLLETADQHRGNSTDILEAVVRLCANLEPGHVSNLHGKITDGTLAAALLLVAEVKFDRERNLIQNTPAHNCLKGAGRGARYDRISERGTWECSDCHCEGVGVKDIRFGYQPITFEMVKKFKINRNMFG